MQARCFGTQCLIQTAIVVAFTSSFQTAALAGQRSASDEDIVCKTLSSDNKTCYIDDNFSTHKNYYLTFDGDIVFKANVSLASHATISINASGSLTFESGVRLVSVGELILTNRWKQHGSRGELCDLRISSGVLVEALGFLSILGNHVCVETGASVVGHQYMTLGTPSYPSHVINVSASVTATLGLKVNSGSIILRSDGKLGVNGSNYGQLTRGSVTYVTSSLVMTVRHAYFENSSVYCHHGNLTVVALDNVSLVNNASLGADNHVLLVSSNVVASRARIFSEAESLTINSSIELLNGTNATATQIFLGCATCQVTTQPFAQLSGKVSPSNVTVEGINCSLKSRVNASFFSITDHGNVSVGGNFSFKDPLFPFSVSAAGSLTLSANLSGFHSVQLVARNVTLAENLVIQTNANSCSNGVTHKNDLCDTMTGVKAESGLSLALHQALLMRKTNLSFDFVIMALEGVEVGKNAILNTASSFVCAGGAVKFGSNLSIDSRGRGCATGNGSGAPQLSEHNASGGGSSTSQGGYAQCGVNNLCGWPGLELVHEADQLPTVGAAGGGMIRYLHPVPRRGAGGGLVWLSAASFSFTGSARIMVDGTSGSPHDFPLVVGGGAGGQLLMYTSGLQFQEKVLFSAKGGEMICGRVAHTKIFFGGGGAGGYVGLGWKKPSSTNAEHYLTIEVDGGDVSSDSWCRTYNRDPSTRGNQGRKSSLLPCDAGHKGMYCSMCPIGKYGDTVQNNDNDVSCAACTNKPALALYTQAGCGDKNCDFECLPSVPPRSINPLCLDFLTYALSVVGKKTEWVTLMAFLGFILLLVLVRHVKAHRRHHMMSPVALANQTCDEARRKQKRWKGSARQALPWHRRCQESSEATEEVHDRKLLTFTKEQLPFHVCRIFLSGRNNRHCPWVGDSRLPRVLEPLIVEIPWEHFQNDVTRAASVLFFETWIEKVLMILYTPIALMYSRRQRRRRAQRIQRSVHEFSEGIGGRRSWAEGASRICFWRPIRARGASGSSSGELAMAFGCDSGATLGYIDFFDFARSQFNWAPADLRSEVRLFLAHGDGSHAEPFAINVGCVLVEHLAQMGLGALQVYSVMSTFNRISRLISMSDMKQGFKNPLLCRLRSEVQESARVYGVPGNVQVFVVAEATCSSSCDLEAIPHSTTTADTFSDLAGGSIQSVQEESLLAPPAGTASGANSQVESSISYIATTQITGRNTNLVLCLAFADSSVWTSSRSFMSETRRPAPLMSPIPCSSVGEFLPQVQPPRTEDLDHERSPPWSRLLTEVLEKPSFPTVVLMFFVTLLLLDILLFILVLSCFARLSVLSLVLSLLVMPLAQPVSLVMGIMFALTEDLRRGKLFVSMTCTAMVNGIFVSILLAINEHYARYVILYFSIFSSLKVLEAVCALLQTCSIEVVHDMSFMSTSQVVADFAPAVNYISPGQRSETRSNTWDRLGSSKGRGVPSLSSDRGVEVASKRLPRQALSLQPPRPISPERVASPF